ncbi:unnamed protein product [Prunus armeniaca]|uniref:RING-type E3 ubiquitin transferase n=1 Tax=Prunus armeniaca TaxID=36596 RepID=A0A6J5UP40_PRUAR|nr:unnamed protein product [Prunus armeniaca]
MQITPKLKTFIWEHGKLLANVQRQIRNLTTHCPICPAEPETLEHLLISAARLIELLGRSGYVSCLMVTSRLIEVNEIAVRVVMLLAFLFHQRLLQLKWYTQLHDRNLKASWVAEKKVFLACSPLYIAGGFVALFMNVKQNQLHIVKHFLRGCLRSYAGLVLDCFVFPQVLLNIFLNSKESALSW